MKSSWQAHRCFTLSVSVMYDIICWNVMFVRRIILKPKDKAGRISFAKLKEVNFLQ